MPPIQPDPLGPLLEVFIRVLDMLYKGLIRYKNDRAAALMAAHRNASDKS
jgi:hypothetical protein